MSIIAKLKSFEYSLIQKKILKRLIEDNGCKCNSSGNTAEPSNVFIFVEDYNNENIAVYDNNIYNANSDLIGDNNYRVCEIFSDDAYNNMCKLYDIYGEELTAVIKYRYYGEIIEYSCKFEVKGEDSHGPYFYLNNIDENGIKRTLQVTTT